MKVRHKEKGYIGYSGAFNESAIWEIIVYFEDGGASSEYPKDYDVEIDGGWKDLNQAFKDHDVIPDNYNTTFFLPPTEEDRQRGFTL